MAQSEASRQFSFRLPTALVQQIERCTDIMRTKGLEVSRADVVRLLLKYALENSKCKLSVLLKPSMVRSGAGKKRQ
jgi:hypothetical protein